MDFRLSDETLEWKDYCRKFAREVIRPAAAEHDRDESVPYEVMRGGLRVEARRARLDPGAPERPRGAEGRHLRRGAPLGLRRHRARDLRLVALRRRHRLLAARPSRSGAGSRRWSAPRSSPRIGAYAVTEPQAGSDVKSLRTTAKRDGDDWILNGTKTFISNGGIADVTVVVATVDPELGHRGQASFIVTEDNPGLKLGHKESKLGIRASQTAEIVLEDCRVPGDALLGGEEKLQQKLERARSGQRSRLFGRARDVRDHAPDRRRVGARDRAGRLRVDARVPRRPQRERPAAARRSSASSR